MNLRALTREEHLVIRASLQTMREVLDQKTGVDMKIHGIDFEEALRQAERLFTDKDHLFFLVDKQGEDFGAYRLELRPMGLSESQIKGFLKQNRGGG